MYQVLARKYRPRNFNELVGQSHVSRALTSALDRGRLHHAYLFTGTRGVGKTTIARILAKCLNCETGVTSTPCEQCATCQAVNAGRFIDLIEIDAASRTKVEDTRELLDNVPYAPTQGRYKVYLIDEVHMLSTHSFNALLKTLEEPPAHVKFLFATTDPQKLPITVISRCLQFTLRPLAVDEITQHLEQILKTEAITAEHDALWQIAEAAQGSVRDALSLTDQAIAFGQGEIHHQDVKDMLGLIDRSIIYDLLAAIHQNKQQQVSQLLLQFRQQALDVALVLDQLISTLHELALLQHLPDLSLKYSEEINHKIKKLSAVISAQDLQLYYQIACKGRADLQMAVTQEQGFEMTVLRLLAFRPLSLEEISYSTGGSAHIVLESNITVAAPTETSGTEQGIIAAPTAVQPPRTQAESTHAVQAMPSSQPTAVVHETAQESPVPNHVIEVAADHVLEIGTHTAETVTLTETIERVAPVVQPEILESTGAVAATATTSRSEAPALTSFISAADDRQTALHTIDIASLSDQDAFFLDPQRDATLQAVVEQPMVPQTAVVEQNQVIEQSQAHQPLFQQAAEQPHLQNSQAALTGATSQPKQMPQDILALAPQQLDGEWDVHKWEYWFRSSGLPPAVQELAQQGLMTGQINGASVFHTTQQYENLLAQAQFDLQQALSNQWPDTRFSVEYKEIAEITPFILQNQRKEKAFQCATDLLHQEPVVKSLVETFEAELNDIQIK